MVKHFSGLGRAGVRCIIYAWIKNRDTSQPSFSGRDVTQYPKRTGFQYESEAAGYDYFIRSIRYISSRSALPQWRGPFDLRTNYDNCPMLI